MRTLREMSLLLDEDDWNTIQSSIAEYQATSRFPVKDGGGVMLPEGDSNLAGAIIGELLRSLEEYRSLYEAGDASN